MDKLRHRMALLEQRRGLTEAERRDAAQRLFHVMKDAPEFQAAQSIAFYHAINGELDPVLLVDAALEAGKKCVLPVLEADESLSFVPYKVGDSLVPNRFDILEPVKTVSNVLDSQVLDLIFVPFVGVTEDKYRLGMGGGSYDMTFAYKLAAPESNPKIIGIGYQFQKIDNLKKDDWDVPCDRVVLV